MADEIETVILTQPDGERLALDLLQHRFAGQVEHVHGTAKGAPLVHMVCWDTDEPCPVEVSGSVEMTHRFEGVHAQHFDVAPVDHTLHVDSALAEPIHHALQMRTPLQVRFCNPWKVDSDYTVDVALRDRPFLSIHLRGSTVATPEPCDDEPCPPIRVHAGHP